jgi:recombinational DNA repair protein (RecF pathway)
MKTIERKTFEHPVAALYYATKQALIAELTHDRDQQPACFAAFLECLAR